MHWIIFHEFKKLPAAFVDTNWGGRSAATQNFIWKINQFKELVCQKQKNKRNSDMNLITKWARPHKIMDFVFSVTWEAHKNWITHQKNHISNFFCGNLPIIHFKWHSVEVPRVILFDKFDNWCRRPVVLISNFEKLKLMCNVLLHFI